MEGTDIMLDLYYLEALDPIERAQVIMDSVPQVTRNMVSYIIDITDESIRRSAANIFLMHPENKKLSGNAKALLLRAIGEYKPKPIGALARPYVY